MKSQTILLVIAVSICALCGVSSTGSPGKCPSSCNRDNRPVCASWSRGGQTSICTFPNICRVRLQSCRRNQAWRAITQSACTRNSNDCRALVMN